MFAIKTGAFDQEYLSFMCSEFADILKAGMSSSEGFLLLAERETDSRARAVLNELNSAVSAGASTSAAMRESGAFPEYMLRMVAIGEKTGYLESVFRSLRSYFDRQIAIRRTFRSAVGYPVLLLIVMLVVFFIFICEVLPVFNDVFKQLGVTMSPMAVSFMNFGLAVRNARYILLAILCAIVLAAVLIRFIPSWNSAFAGRISKLGRRSRIGRCTGQARFAASLSLAYSGLADMDEALALARDFCGDREREARVDRARDRMTAGEPIADALSAEDVFSSMYTRMITIGIRTGSLENSLMEISRRSGDELNRAIDRFTSRVEPVTVIVLSLCVGLLLVSIMMPLIGVLSAI